MNESVQKWLDELTVTPSSAIQKLVLGYASVSAWSRSSLRESFAEIFQVDAGALDAAVAGWLRERLMKLPPEKTPTLVWTSHLQDLFSALAGLPLPQVAGLLRDGLRDFRSWLRPLRTEDGLDPEAAYLTALAWARTNQHLEGMWEGLALLRNHEPAYYTDIGLLGLRKTRDEHGQLPSKAPFLLLTTLIDLADTGISQKDWLLTTRAMLGGYNYSLETWMREFEPVLEARPEAVHGPEWLKKVLPQPRAKDQNQRHYERAVPPAHSREEKDTMIREVAGRGPTAIGEKLTSFLALERAYANTTRNPYFLVRTFNRLAEAARMHDPDWALARAEEALAWDEDNPRNWTVLARCLWARGRIAYALGDFAKGKGDLMEAIDTLWEAQLRFPTDAHSRTELAKILRASGDLESAEAIYRVAVAEFPSNPWCLNGLADVLIQRARAEANKSLVDEAHSLLLRSSAMGNEYASGRLENMRYHDEESVEGINLGSPSQTEMRPPQRLGRALLLQWRARRSSSVHERERLFAEAESLLELPDELTGGCRITFLEARGFLLLARNLNTEARTYFEQQISAFTRPPLGLRLGFAEARARLGETLDDIEEAELVSFGHHGSILPLVLKVVRLLELNASDKGLRNLLIELYPRVRELAGMPLSELGETEEVSNPSSTARQSDAMMAQILLANVFNPAAIYTPDDLRTDDALIRVCGSFKSHRDDIFSLYEKLALAA